MNKDTLRRIAVLYGYNITMFGPVASGYRNSSHSFVTTDGRKLNFILYKREPGITELIRRTNALGTYIATRGLPVRAPVDERILRVGERFGSLYAYIDGETIPWEAYSMKHIKLLGYALARFHAVSEGFSGELPNVEDVYEAIYFRMAEYFGNPQIQDALQEKLDLHIVLPNFPSALIAARQLTPRIALHMDMVRSNLLFQNVPTGSVPSEALQVGTVTLSGILDLEKAAYGHPMFDVARTLAFLLVDCDKPEEKVRKYFLESGYRKRGGGKLPAQSIRALSTFSGALGSNYQFVSSSALAGKAEPSKAPRAQIDEHSLLEQLITMFLTYDFYKFLRQNPYESLSKNHHFIRTERILRERKVLQ